MKELDVVKLIKEFQNFPAGTQEHSFCTQCLMTQTGSLTM